MPITPTVCAEFISSAKSLFARDVQNPEEGANTNANANANANANVNANVNANANANANANVNANTNTNTFLRFILLTSNQDIQALFH